MSVLIPTALLFGYGKLRLWQRMFALHIQLFFRATLIFFFASAANAASDADLLLFNGNVYTVDERQPHAEAIAVKDHRIVFVGSNDEAKKRWGETPSSCRIDLKGKTVVPGFTDSHCH